MDNRSANVLIIENEPSVAGFLMEYLKRAQNFNFKASWRSSLAEGLNHFKNNPVDIVVLDLGLPDSDGYETFEKIRKQQPNVPIVIISGIHDEEMAIKTIENGAQDYLVKGQLDLDSLSRTLRYSIVRFRARKK
ncbi:MAG: response regulator [Candidatus Omnitrophica bacterium]|nr:response regulator [Candidatus Omnitrophota bacterium]